jgi:phosphoglycolate phosphatase
LDSVGLRRPSLAEAVPWIGDGVEALIRRGLEAGLGHEPDADLLGRTLDAFDACYRVNLYRSSRLFPGVAETLKELRDAGLILGCITNKREAYARALIDRAGIAELLSFVCGGDTFPTRKPDPAPLLAMARRCGCEPNEAVMVGDSDNDAKAASRAGFGFVFAAYGYVPSAGLTVLQRSASITSFRELVPLLCGRTGAK